MLYLLPSRFGTNCPEGKGGEKEVKSNPFSLKKKKQQPEHPNALQRLNGINDNPLSSRWKKRLSEQPAEVQLKIKELDEKDPRDYQLRVIKRSRKKPQEGDVFLLSPREGVYFYGRVLKANIDNIQNDTFISGQYSILLFKNKTKTPDISSYAPDYNELLLKPCIVSSGYWTRGFFFTIANDPINAQGKGLDYGFYSIGKGKYMNESGHELDRQPAILGTYGISTLTGIARQIEQELIINPGMLSFD